MTLLNKLLEWVTLKSWRLRRARGRYDFLKAKICERHFGGYAGLVVDFPGKRFSREDVSCFKAPMYYAVKNRDDHWVIFWDRARMTREIGVGAPLKEGEAMIPDTVGRTNPAKDPGSVDEKKPLTIPVVQSGQKKDV